MFLCMAVTMLWKERSRIMTVQMDNFRVLLGIRRMDRVLNGVKRVDERTDGSAMWKEWRVIRLPRESM